VCSRLLWRSGLSTRFRIDCGSFELIFFPSSHSAALWVDPSSAEPDQRVVAALLRPGEFVADVGANVGVLTLEASRAVGATGTVLAFEAHPRTAGYLERNVQSNHATNVQVHRVACGAEPGTVSFNDLGHSDTQNRVDEQNASALKVPVVRLDDLIDPDQAVALLKVDVEGYERFVFEGAQRVLDHVDFVYFEVGDRLYEKYGYSTADVSALLTGRGFELYALTPGHAERLPPDYRPNDFGTVENLLATRNRRLLWQRWVDNSTV
jgi:FkbM family methyltransferase